MKHSEGLDNVLWTRKLNQRARVDSEARGRCLFNLRLWAEPSFLLGLAVPEDRTLSQQPTWKQAITRP